MKTPIVLISGPVGVGKSVVGGEVGEVLETKRIPHTFVDFDQLRYTYPKPADDPWGNRLALENLAAIWSNAARYGSVNLIISYVVEEAAFVDSLLATLPSGAVTIIQLSARTDTLAARLRGRETGSGLDWHLNRSVELAASLARDNTPSNFRIVTDGRTVMDIARDIVDKVQWRQA